MQYNHSFQNNLYDLNVIIFYLSFFLCMEVEY